MSCSYSFLIALSHRRICNQFKGTAVRVFRLIHMHIYVYIEMLRNVEDHLGMLLHGFQS